jgi:predicted Zn-dependent protease
MLKPASMVARAAVLFTLASCLPAQVLLDVMTQELQRNFEGLKKADPAPYFLSYSVTEVDSRSVTASFGSLTSQNATRRRYFDVTVRVGSPELDNYRRIRGDMPQFTTGAAISLDDNPAALKRRMWSETDRAYRAAAERFIKIRTNAQVRVAAEDTSGDFSREEPQTKVESVPALEFDAGKWTTRVRKLSQEFSKFPAVLTATVGVSAQVETKRLVSSEGSRLEHGRGFARVTLTAQGKAADGMDLMTTRSFEAVDASGLPDEGEIREAIHRIARDLTALLQAPVVDPFVGPAVFSGRAAGVFFHEIFGHRVEGHRQKEETEGQTFTKAINTRILPEFISVVFDPTRRRAADTDLHGWYSFDDEGMAARPVKLVENGILKTFLMSRSPVRGFDHSNGHGRRQPGLEVVARQSNLLVESSRQADEKKLRAMLIEEAKRQGKPYGLYFADITGGFTTTGRGGLQAFKVLPLVVYRVYADGRPDELVRGADIVGTPLASFGKILATSEKPEVFNGYCGAESGSVPVSAVAPAMLVSEIEIEKRAKSQDRPPLLPPPPGGSE